METAEQQSSGAWLFNEEGPRSILEKPSEIPRAFPTPVMDVHIIMEVCCTHTGDGIASNYLHAWSQNQSAVYPAMSYGAMSHGVMSPGIFVEKGSGLLPTTAAKGKLGWMSELQIGQSSESPSVSCPWPWAKCHVYNWPELNSGIIRGFMPSAATLRYLPTVLDMRSNLS